MNEIFLSPFGRPGTQAAEGLPRWRWTVEEIERIAATGIFNEQDRFELIGGEIVPMMSAVPLHPTDCLAAATLTPVIFSVWWARSQR